jgi:hypothetical protein
MRFHGGDDLVKLPILLPILRQSAKLIAPANIPITPHRAALFYQMAICFILMNRI